MIKCPHCGAVNNTSAIFCVSCHTNIHWTPNDQTRLESDNKPKDKITNSLMRMPVIVLSVLGLGIHFFFIMLLGAASGLSDSSSQTSGKTALLLITPFFYFGYCLLSSIGQWRIYMLLISGIIAHLLVFPFILRLFRDGVPFFGVPIFLVALCWVGMFLEANAKRRE